MRENLSPSGPEDEEELPEPSGLKWLRRSVMGLMVVLGLGMALIAGTIAWRLGWNEPAAAGLPAPVAAEALVLPEGAEILALGGSGAEIFVALRYRAGGEALLTFRRADGALLSETPIARE